MKSRIAIYDFDGTLFNSPSPDAGRIRYKEITGFDYPHIGWWGRIETLSHPLVPEIPSDEWYRNDVISHYHDDRSCSNTNLILMTGRTYKFQSRIMQILDARKLKFEQYFFAGKRDTQGSNGLEIKCNNIKHIVKPHHNKLEVCEDRQYQIEVFKEFFGLLLKKSNLKEIIIHDAVSLKSQIMK